LQSDDMLSDGTSWSRTDAAGTRCTWQGVYRRRIEPQQPSDSEPVPDNDDDIERAVEELENNMTVTLLDAAQQRCRELDADLRTAEQQNAELSALLAEADRGGQQVNAELQQLREQVATLTQERDRYRNQLAGAIEHSSAAEAQAQLVDRLQAWLRPVLEVVADHPDHSSILAASVLEFLPQIASRLIEE
jgi:chromosome segregation ATPase